MTPLNIKSLKHFFFKNSTLLFMKINIILILITLLFMACTPRVNIPIGENSKSFVPAKEKFMVLIDDKYTEVALDKKPEPVNGRDQFYKDVYMDFRYPANARYKGIQGSVIFEITINESGIVEDIVKLEGLTKECDEEAQAAIERGCKNGFTPAVYNGKKTKVKYVAPVNFRIM